MRGRTIRDLVLLIRYIKNFTNNVFVNGLGWNGNPPSRHEGIERAPIPYTVLKVVQCMPKPADLSRA